MGFLRPPAATKWFGHALVLICPGGCQVPLELPFRYRAPVSLQTGSCSRRPLSGLSPCWVGWISGGAWLPWFGGGGVGDGPKRWAHGTGSAANWASPRGGVINGGCGRSAHPRPLVEWRDPGPEV